MLSIDENDQVDLKIGIHSMCTLHRIPKSTKLG